MNIRDLNYIIAVSELKNFTAAANISAISQPTLSTQIKKLEEYLNVQIFVRENNNITITDIGEQIIEVSKKIIGDVNLIKSIAKNATNPHSSKVSLGSFPSLASYVFPEYIFRLKQHFPDIKMTLVEEKTDALITLLLSMKLDAALLALPVYNDELECVSLFEDQFFLAVADDHHLANVEEIEISDLVQEKLLLLDEGHCLRNQVLELCSSSRFIDDDFRASSLETLRFMVKNGQGITLMPSVAINPDETEIKYIPIKSNPVRNIGLFWKKNHPRRQFFHTIANLISYKPTQ